MDQHVDVVVIGAGLQGLAAAKTYLQCAPKTNLLILDTHATIGGVWSIERIYPGLRSNNLIGTYEYTDFPMHEGYGVKKEGHIPGETIHKYMCDFAEEFDLMERIQLRTQVLTAELIDEHEWKLKVVSWEPSSSTDDLTSEKTNSDDQSQSHEYSITCAKLIVATGLTSTPTPMSIAGSQTFKSPIVNFASLPHTAPALLSSPNTHHVTIYGGSKAAYDCVYLFASSGKRVTWVIRASGHGPTYMSPSHINLGPFRVWVEKLMANRVLTWLSPCVWGHADGFGWIRGLLHGTWVGRKVVGRFWREITGEIIGQTNLKKHQQLQKLLPLENVFWMGTGLGILNYPSDIHEFIRSGQVQIVRKDVVGLEGDRGVKFLDGEVVQTDAFVYHGGWKFSPGIEVLPRDKHGEYGMPSTYYSEEQKAMWEDLNQRADQEIFQRFPALKDGPRRDHNSLLVRPIDILDPSKAIKPVEKPKSEQYAPWRLWRGIAPPGQVLQPERNLVFLGMIMNTQGALRAEISSLWAYAYLNHKLKEPVRSISTRRWTGSMRTSGVGDLEKGVRLRDDRIMYETALFGRFGKWRYPCGQGARLPDFVFDGLPYFDLLLGDLGLRTWRKPWGWLGEIFGGSYGQADYRGFVQEWLQKTA